MERAPIDELDAVRHIIEAWGKLSPAARSYVALRLSSAALAAEPPVRTIRALIAKDPKLRYELYPSQRPHRKGERTFTATPDGFPEDVVKARKEGHLRPPAPKRPKMCTFTGGCDNERLAKGLCASHYRQLHSGRPLRPIRRHVRWARAETTTAAQTVPEGAIDSGRKCGNCRKPLLTNPRTASTFHRTEQELARCRLLQENGTNGTSNGPPEEAAF